MVRIEGGEFVIGMDADEEDLYFQFLKEANPNVDDYAIRNYLKGWRNDQPLTLPSFAIAQYPVTNAQWELFIDDNGYNPDAPWWDEAGRAWLLRDDHATEGLETYHRRDYKQHPEWWRNNELGIARPNRPVVGISWCEAVAFCRWLTQHQDYNPEGCIYLLPSEAEWEYAARRATRRTYPWGDEEPDAERSNFDSVYNSTTAVGCFAPGATQEDGLHDLAGNVWEWTRSEYRKYPYDPADGREDMNNPAGKTLVLRGGGWSNPSSFLRASCRYGDAPDVRDVNVGCRVARRLPRA
jgi:formylglycine-generating enzyme required for sulfatase activity